MNILVLSPYPESILSCFSEDTFTVTKENIDIEFLEKSDFDLGISYGYRHILKKPVIDLLPIINMHISYLPWNRGADPHIWSWVEGTPKGVTIHFIDEGIDTGPIIAQKSTPLDGTETINTSYWKLRKDLEQLFRDTWPLIRSGAVGKNQPHKGTYHEVKDRERILHLMPYGMETPVKNLLGP